METLKEYYSKINNIIKQRINELNIFIDADFETKKTIIKKSLYKNRILLFYLTIIAMLLAFLTLEFETRHKVIHKQKGGNPLAGMTDQIKNVFGVVGEKLQSAGQYMVDRLKFIWYTVFAFAILGLMIISPLFIYLFIIFMMFKFMVKGTMQM
jgi:hypothetical protein